MVQRSTLYADLMHRVTDGRTDGRQYDANSGSYCVRVRSAKMWPKQLNGVRYIFLSLSTFIVFFVYVFVNLGQLLAQFKNTALLSFPLYMHMYIFLCLVHGQIKWWWWWWWWWWWRFCVVLQPSTRYCCLQSRDWTEHCNPVDVTRYVERRREAMTRGWITSCSVHLLPGEWRPPFFPAVRDLNG